MTKLTHCAMGACITLCASTLCLSEDAFPDSYVIPISLIGQQESQWCWAASAQMIMEAYGKHVISAIRHRVASTMWHVVLLPQ